MKTQYKLKLDDKSQNINIKIDKYNDINFGIFRVTRKYGEFNLSFRVTTRENNTYTTT